MTPTPNLASTSFPLDRGDVEALSDWRDSFDFARFQASGAPWRGYLVDGRSSLAVSGGTLLPVSEPPAGAPFLLGRTSDGVVHVAWLVDDFPDGVDGSPLALLGVGLEDDGALLAAEAVALGIWHATYRFCGRCGGPLAPIQAGWASQCQQCRSVEFPRSDPAVIVRITDDEDRLLLAHNRVWPPHRMSLPAGFIEAGETPRRAVAREIREEVGLTVTDQQYLGAQPWPGPHSLMLAFAARVAPDSGPAVPDGEEIDEVGFFSRVELLEAFEARGVIAPGPTSIASRVIENWLGRQIPRPQDAA